MFGNNLVSGDNPMIDGMYSGFGKPIDVPAARKKTGMFGSNGQKIAEILGAVASTYLASRGNPVGMLGLQMMQQRRQQAMDEQQYQQRRGDKLADYAEMQKIQAQYGAPPAPHYFEDNGGNQWAIGADGVPKMVHKDDLPFKLVPNGLGGVVPVDLRTLMGGQSAPQITEDDWANGQPIGGSTPQASSGFPRPR